MKLDAQLHIMAANELHILSAHLQDAIIRIGDIAFLPHARRFAVICNRFCWENEKQNQRIVSGLHFEHVKKTTSCGMNQKESDRCVQLLAICFEAGQTPGGNIHLIFADQSKICLEVEAVEACLNNIDEAWAVKSRPSPPILGQAS